MKRNLVKILTTAALLICLFALGILAISAETEGYYTYSVTNGEATITGVNSSISGDIEIPAKLGGYTVTSIGDQAFYYRSRLTSITIPEGVTSIGEWAFSNCSSLTSVAFGENSQLTSIGDVAFCYCSNLTSITIPEGVTSIGDGAFYGCSSLTSITFESVDTEIYDSEYTISSTATIRGYANSTAQAYAEKYGRTFELIEDEPEDDEVMYGDANNDGTVNGQDLLLLRKYLANFDYDTNTSTIEVDFGADANGDGAINGQDLLLLRKYLANYDYETGTSTIVLGPAA